MRFFNRWFIALFMAMMLLPLVFVDLSSNRISVKENRMLAERPKLADIKSHPEIFIRQFDAWFKDSTGFRELLLALYNVSGMNLMSGVQYAIGPNVYLVGEYGHHFFAGVNGDLQKRFLGEPILSDEYSAGMANKLEEIKVYLDKRGISFVVMFCTYKEEIYPEFYPKSIKQGHEPIQLDIITDYLKEHTSVDVFNIRQALLAQKDNYLLYSVSSGDLSHYTEIGAFFAYRELMKHINTYFPEITPYELNDIVISYDKEHNIEPDVSLKIKNKYKKLGPSFFDDVELKRPFVWENTAYENIDANLPVILVFRDSYSGYFSENDEKKFITQFIASHFGRAIFIHYEDLKNFEEYVDKYKPDIIVFEAVRPDSLAFSVSQIPELATVRGSLSETPE